MQSEALQARAVLRKALQAFRPPPSLLVSSWADSYRVLNTNSPLPGNWQTKNTPFLREIMDSLSPSDPCELVVFQKAAQLGGSEVLLNAMGFYLEHAPCPILVVEPTSEAMKRFSRYRIEPLIASTPALRAMIRDSRVRDCQSHNTVLLKRALNGAVLVMSGANSSVGLRSTPVKVLLCDEVDAWPLDVDQEGDPYPRLPSLATILSTWLAGLAGVSARMDHGAAFEGSASNFRELHIGRNLAG